MDQALAKDSVTGDQVIRVEAAHSSLHLITLLQVTVAIMVIIIMEATITVVAIIPIEDNSNSKENNN
jgi:hypothetical protein